MIPMEVINGIEFIQKKSKAINSNLCQIYTQQKKTPKGVLCLSWNYKTKHVIIKIRTLSLSITLITSK